MKKISIWKIVFSVLAILVIGLGIGIAVYINDFYHATPEALEALQSSEMTKVSKIGKDTIIFSPIKEKVKAGFIFYPGGKVQYEAYAPMLQALSEQGILCILVHMPCNLAILDKNAANGLQKKFPKITNWYIGGHSLGGAMAASYVANHVKEYKGLVLCASYSTVNLKNSELDILSLYGTNDDVLNMEKYKKNLVNLPKERMREKVIEGGCHAYFGSYGEQKGDGTPTITSKEQQTITANEIAYFIN